MNMSARARQRNVHAKAHCGTGNRAGGEALACCLNHAADAGGCSSLPVPGIARHGLSASSPRAAATWYQE
jgi:hypothetical protein